MLELLLYDISGREIAAHFWLTTILLYAIFNRAIRNSIIEFLKIFFSKQILVINVLSTLYIILCVYLLSFIGIWIPEFTRDTIYWTFGTAVILLFSHSTDKASNLYFSDIVKKTIGMMFIIEYIINLHSFEVIVELFALPILTLFVMIDQVAKYKNIRNVIVSFVKICMSVYVGTILLISFFVLIINIYNNNLYVILRFVNQLALCILYMPFLYVFLVFIRIESVFVGINIRMKNATALNSLAKKGFLKLTGYNLYKILLYTTPFLRSIHDQMTPEDLVDLLNKLKFGFYDLDRNIL